MPSVQRTQEKSKSVVRCSLNVASTAGFFQPRISNPWPPVDLLRRDDKNTDDMNTEGAASSAPTN